MGHTHFASFPVVGGQVVWVRVVVTSAGSCACTAGGATASPGCSWALASVAVNFRGPESDTGVLFKGCFF